MDVFKVFSLARVPPLLWSRSPTFGVYGGFQGLHPGQSSTAVAEPIVDIPVPHGGQHLQDPGLASIPQEVAGEAFQGFFLALFPGKIVRL